MVCLLQTEDVNTQHIKKAATDLDPEGQHLRILVMEQKHQEGHAATRNRSEGHRNPKRNYFACHVCGNSIYRHQEEAFQPDLPNTHFIIQHAIQQIKSESAGQEIAQFQLMSASAGGKPLL